MSVIVDPIEKQYFIEMNHEGTKVVFTFEQLSYSAKAKIVSATTQMKQGKMIQDFTLNCYLAVKHALKNVEGLHCLVEGKEQEYKLKFDNDGLVSDVSLNEIFNTPFEDKLVYTASHLQAGIPEKIIHPLTGEELEGVEILAQKGGTEKK